MPQALGQKWSGVFECQGRWEDVGVWVVMAVTVSTVLGPGLTASNQAAGSRGSSDQTRSDQTRSPQLPVEITPGVRRGGGVAQILPRNLPNVSESVLGSRVEARQAGEATGRWGARYWRKADANGSGQRPAGQSKSRIEQIRREARWASWRGKNKTLLAG